MLACLALNFGPQTGATILRNLCLGGSRAASTLAITLPGTLMYILPIKYHAKCSARLVQEYIRQVHTVCLFFLRKTEGALASQKGALGTQKGDLAYFVGGGDVY